MFDSLPQPYFFGVQRTGVVAFLPAQLLATRYLAPIGRMDCQFLAFSLPFRRVVSSTHKLALIIRLG